MLSSRFWGAAAAAVLLTHGGMSMAQTIEELEAEKKRLTLEKDVLALRKDVETGKKSLADAVTPPPQTPAEKAAAAKAEADAQKAVYDAQKAAADARAAVDAAEIKALVGTVPSSGLTGAITTKTDAGKGEATLLSAKAVATASATVATAVKAKVGEKRVIVYAGDSRPRFQNWRMFRIREHLLGKAFESATQLEVQARAANDQLGAAAVDKAAGAAEAPALAVAGAALEALKNLGSFFQTDYEIGGITLTADDQLLIGSVVGRLATEGVKVIDPARHTPSVSDQAIITLLDKHTPKAVEAAEHVDSMTALAAAAREKAAAQRIGEKQKQRLLNVAASFDRAASAWKAAASGYESLIKDLGTADDKGVIWGVKVSEEQTLSEALEKGDFALFLDVNNAVGGYYTKKNVWTFFGTMPFYAMGGAVVTYALVAGEDATVSAAGMIPVHSGYAKVMKVPDLVK